MSDSPHEYIEELKAENRRLAAQLEALTRVSNELSEAVTKLRDRVRANRIET